MPSTAILLFALAGVNILAFASLGFDKVQARVGVRRTPEANLLILAAIGGTAGAYAGRAYFRHKTRKQPFSSRLHGIAIAQLLGLAALFGWYTGG